MTERRSRRRRYAVALAGMARPDQLALICVVYALGVLVAVARGGEHANVLVGVGALLAVAVAVHYANEYADYETDALTTPTPYSGGSGVLHATGLERAFAWRALVGASALATVAVLASAVAGLPATAIALLSVILVAGVAYSLGPRLAWRGLGELTNALLGGLALPLYGVAVTGTTPDVVDVLTFLPFTAIVFANLLATQWPDRRADAEVGKRTLAVILRVRTLRGLYTFTAIIGLGGITTLVATGLAPLALLALAAPTTVLLVVGAHRYGRVESPAVTVHAMVVLAFAYVITAAFAW
ncbi:prenyltransferase [Halorubellus salinus]|uniref:prenyltransferase n=1 Tax=Halorubellus salinus TaxID=755309 RepID=UPI001D07E5C8